MSIQLNLSILIDASIKDNIMSNAFALGSEISEGDHKSIEMHLCEGSIYFYFYLFCDKIITNRIKVSILPC